LQLATFGIASLRNDPNGASVSTLRLNSGSGGSFFLGGTNSSIVEMQGRIGYRVLPTFDMYISATHSVWGQAAPHGLILSGGIQAQFGYNPNTPAIKLTPDQFGQPNRGFINYSMDAKILKTNDRLSLVKIDKGSQDGIEVGQVFDIFWVKKDGSLGEAFARGEITHTQLDEAALTITEFFKDVVIEDGFVVKRLIQ
jgi:hypothetical protein